MIMKTSDYFKDKISIVTGGGSGIGLALCEKLAEYGSTVVVSDINKSNAEKAALKINNAGGRAVHFTTDVSRLEDVERLITNTYEKYGNLHLMFNNAGIGITGEVRDISIEMWERIVKTNLLGVIYGTTTAYRIMIQQGYGHIINIASLQGLLPLSISVPYTATKYGVVGLSTALRPEAAALGIRVSVVCPAFIETKILDIQPCLCAKREDVFSRAPKNKMSAEKCAGIILSRVAKNRGIITVPLYAGILWRLYRFLPAAVDIYNKNFVNFFHRIREDNRER